LSLRDGATGWIATNGQAGKSERGIDSWCRNRIDRGHLLP
jgi:hypothetical protein